MEEVKQTLIAAPNKLVTVYSDIRLAGYTLPQNNSFTQGLKTQTAQQFFDNDILRLRSADRWQIILQNAGLANQ